MVKSMQFAYNGMMRDVAKSKHPQEFYWDALNVRVTADEKQSSAVLTNEKGNQQVINFPAVTITSSLITYNGGKTRISYQPSSGIAEQLSSGALSSFASSHKIVAMVAARRSLIVFTTSKDLSTTTSGMDCIWEVTGILNETYTANLLYVRNLGFSAEKPLQVLYNYENENIEKVYWVDGQEQVRSLNLREKDSPINIAIEALDMVGTVSFSQPVITQILTGGKHTAGMIQYAYNLYRLNSAQTKFGPLSEIKPLAKTNGGGDVNEVVGATPVVQINDIDTRYDSIKVYAIKYTSLNEQPSVSLIADREIGNDPSLTIYDDGSIISTIGIDEFAFLGSDPIVPQHIEIKDSRMFFFNIKQKNFLLPDELDMRAYSWSSIRSYRIVNTPVTLENPDSSDSKPSSSNNAIRTISYTNPDSIKWAVGTRADAINFDYDIYKFQQDGLTLGGEGKYIKYQILQRTAAQLSESPSEYRFLKDNELYRIAIRFYNHRGQRSLPKWIADFVTPEGNLEGNYNTLKVTLNQDFKDYINDDANWESEDDRPVGFEILLAERTAADKLAVAQGIITGTIINTPSTVQLSETEKREKTNSETKLPDAFVRLRKEVPSLAPIKPVSSFQSLQFRDAGETNNPLTEIQFDDEGDKGSGKQADTWQVTTFMQMWGPDIIFDDVNISEGVKLHVLGAVKNTENYSWLKEIEIETKQVKAEGKIENGVHPEATGVTRRPIKGSITNLCDRGLINDPNGTDPDKRVSFNQFYRKFGTYIPRVSNSIKSILGAPEIVEKGQGTTIYNNDSRFQYKNNLYGLLSDSENEFGNDGIANRAVINVNCEGAKSIVFALDSTSTDASRFPNWLTLWTETGISAATSDGESTLLAEFRRGSSFKYVGGIYGGFSYEAKKRTSYRTIGPYTPFSPTGPDEVQIDNAGDTYVGNFRFARLSPGNDDALAVGNVQYTEIVEFPVETTVDLKNRNDISTSAWDSKFQPTYNEYHKYNTVYSQKGDLITTTDLDYNLRPVEEFDTRIQSSKVKIPNETIDSWTDTQVNETMDLDGKYGPIRATINHRDNIYTLQEEAVALISINPRVTVSAEDGIPTELGTGAVLSDYNYLTTKSGTINKWSLIDSQTGFYYFDLYNRTWMRFSGNSLIDLFDTYGMNSFIRSNQNILFNFIAMDNPIIGKGATGGYDISTNTVYLTLLQTGKDWTISFNEKTNSFVSFHSYTPAFYINKGKHLFTAQTNSKEIWLQNSDSSLATWNTFYDVKYPWYVVFEVNPQERDCVFNNIEYKGECYLNGTDQPNTTFSHIHAYNEYQDTGKVILTNDSARRKFRMWRIQIPRDQQQIMDRMRGQWIKVKLSGEQPDNLEHVIHNIVFYYTVYP
jgi:hypothetical protein